MAKIYDIVVVGAGAAGVAACEVLNFHGSDFHIVEARQRIGGRMFGHLDRETGVPIELGAEFVHGVPDIRT